ncbi:MAG: ABC transporter substrate-binding protein [Propionibacteriaceae bacterium]|jgi:branched-chain amino acid transport system substrate-binding protein|nr:ABC transporter substrate-binding protein [Propionibacteriaceae bacterium]
MKKTLACSVAATMLLALAACSTPSTDPTGAATDAPTASAGAIKIGATGPLTGGAAIYGQAARNGAQIAVDEINAKGGVQLALNYQDDEHDAEKAVNAYHTLKDWGMQISLGSVTSTPAIATSAENFTDHIFALTPSASSVAVTEGKNNVFQMCFADPNQGSASAQYIADQKLGTKIAVIYKNDDVYSSGIFDTFKTKAAELGLDIVSTTTFTEDSQQDFSVQISDAKSKGADLIFLPIYYTPASLILQQAQSVDYSPKYFGVDGMDGILTLEGFNTSLAEGVMLLTPFNADATDSLTTSFVQKYQSAYGEIPNQFAADGYDCIYAIYQAIVAGNITASMTNAEINDILVAQFTSMTFDGLTGADMTWDASGQVSKAPKGMVITDGAYVGMD